MGILSIGQVARRAGVGVETVRFYEREGFWRNHRAGHLVTGSTRRKWSAVSALLNAHNS